MLLSEVLHWIELCLTCKISNSASVDEQSPHQGLDGPLRDMRLLQTQDRMDVVVGVAEVVVVNTVASDS